MGVVLARIAFITYFIGQLKIIFCFKNIIGTQTFTEIIQLVLVESFPKN